MFLGTCSLLSLSRSATNIYSFLNTSDWFPLFRALYQCFVVILFSVGCLGIVDGDNVELNNLHRQVSFDVSTDTPLPFDEFL